MRYKYLGLKFRHGKYQSHRINTKPGFLHAGSAPAICFLRSRSAARLQPLRRTISVQFVSYSASLFLVERYSDTAPNFQDAKEGVAAEPLPVMPLCRYLSAPDAFCIRQGDAFRRQARVDWRRKRFSSVFRVRVPGSMASPPFLFVQCEGLHSRRSHLFFPRFGKNPTFFRFAY